PAYNEEGNLANLLRHIHQTLRDAGLEHSIVVVDDGSRDHTAEILRSCAQTLPLIIETHTRNQGLGGALRDALKRAVTGAAPGDLIVTMDSDETHSPDLILTMLKRVREGCDIVIASRFQPGSKVQGLAVHRVWISTLACLLFRALFPTPRARDYPCGF